MNSSNKITDLTYEVDLKSIGLKLGSTPTEVIQKYKGSTSFTQSVLAKNFKRLEKFIAQQDDFLLNHFKTIRFTELETTLVLLPSVLVELIFQYLLIGPTIQINQLMTLFDKIEDGYWNDASALLDTGIHKDLHTYIPEKIRFTSELNTCNLEQLYINTISKDKNILASDSQLPFDIHLKIISNNPAHNYKDSMTRITFNTFCLATGYYNTPHNKILDKLALQLIPYITITDKVYESKLFTSLISSSFNNTLRAFIVKYNTAINLPIKSTQTPLQLAASIDSKEICETLLDLKADINRYSDQEPSPLHIALKKHNSAVIQLLLKRNADVNIKNAEGMTALQCAAASESKHTFDLFLKSDSGPLFDEFKTDYNKKWHLGTFFSKDNMKNQLDSGKVTNLHDVLNYLNKKEAKGEKNTGSHKVINELRVKYKK